MARKFTSQIITANDLFEGDVIYLTQTGSWSRDISQAHIAHSPEQVETMLNVAKGNAGQIVGAYAMNIRLDENDKPSPAHFREEFRTRGPSNYFHGKQSEAQSNAQKLVA